MTRIRRVLGDWAGPALFGALYYLSVTGYHPGDPGDYNRWVASGAMAVAAALMGRALSRGERLVPPDHITSLLTAFVISAVLSVVASPQPTLASAAVYTYGSIVALGIGLYLLQRDARPGAGDGYLVVVPVVHLMLLIEVLLWLTWMRDENRIPGAALPNHANVRHFAYHGFVAAAFAAALFVRMPRLGVSAFVLTASALFGIVLTGSRGALYSWFVFVVVAGLLHPARARLVAFCAAAIAAGSAAAWWVAQSQLLPARGNLFARLEGGAASAVYLADRWVVWSDSVRAIVARPWFGFGPEGYVTSRCCSDDFVQPHSFLLQLMLDFGVIGTFLLAALTWVLLRGFGSWAQWYRALRTDGEVSLPAAVLAAYFVYGLVDGMLYHAVPLLLLALLVALLLAAMHRCGLDATASPARHD